ncbi:hypothetical protein DP939_05920 [Spongiactinospora rosea]|uniref:Transposase n=2 Tax=Spongiactinospora rosea TaxID=2248750 RepID=A0A366M4F1_9ACTN|nr:hypothetical protein DP939_05920 [Spongiactinospora rosea]
MVMKNHSPEFKADTVALALSRPDRTLTSTARGLGVSREILRVWVRAAQARGEGGPGSWSRNTPGRRLRGRAATLTDPSPL